MNVSAPSQYFYFRRVLPGYGNLERVRKKDPRVRVVYFDWEESDDFAYQLKLISEFGSAKIFCMTWDNGRPIRFNWNSGEIVFVWHCNYGTIIADELLWFLKRARPEKLTFRNLNLSIPPGLEGPGNVRKIDFELLEHDSSHFAKALILASACANLEEWSFIGITIIIDHPAILREMLRKCRKLVTLKIGNTLVYNESYVRILKCVKLYGRSDLRFAMRHPFHPDEDAREATADFQKERAHPIQFNF